MDREQFRRNYYQDQTWERTRTEFGRALRALSKTALEEILESRHPREREVIKRTVGLNGAPSQGYDVVAEEMGVTIARVRQVESRAISSILESGALRIPEQEVEEKVQDPRERFPPQRSTLRERMADTSSIMIKRNGKWIWLDNGEQVANPPEV